MAAGIMRLFGKTTKGQFLVIGLVLIVLGIVGAALVLSLPNEDPVSPIISSKKEQYYRSVSLMAVFGLLLVAGMGILLLGVALTGLPLVHAAKYHVGVFYVTFFSLLIIPAAIIMRMGSLLVANAMCDTMFVEAWEGDSFASPAGWVALGIGIAILALALLFVILNVMGLAKVSYKPSTPRKASMVTLVLVILAVVVLTALPFIPVIEFDYQAGLQTAIGFETYEPMDITITQAWLEWLGEGETKSAYGSNAVWLSLMTWMLFLTLVFSIIGFIGIALYGANERRPLLLVQLIGHTVLLRVQRSSHQAREREQHRHRDCEYILRAGLVDNSDGSGIGNDGGLHIIRVCDQGLALGPYSGEEGGRPCLGGIPG
jgi:hypothetical protein